MQRLPKGKRQPQKLPVDLQPRDELMLQACAKFRFLRTSHLVVLAGGSEQNLKRRLQKLFHAAYLDRVFDPAELRHYRTHKLGSPQAIYALANKGARYLEANFGFPKAKTRWDLLNRRISSQNTQHTLMVSDFFLTLHTALHNHPTLRLLPVADTLRKLRAPDQDYSDPFPWAYSGLRLKTSLPARDPKGYLSKAVFYPDGFFALQDTTRPSGKNRAFFFLEADNHSFTLPRLRLKLLAHAAYAHAPTNPLQISAFRILHVSRTDKRLQNVWTLAKKLATKGFMPGNLHLFASEERYRTENPAAILFNPIWHVPGDDELHSLL